MNEAQRRDQFLSLVRNRMDPALRGADYDRHFNAVRNERPDLLDNRAAPVAALANAANSDDGDGHWVTIDGNHVFIEGGATGIDAHVRREVESVKATAVKFNTTPGNYVRGIRKSSREMLGRLRPDDQGRKFHEQMVKHSENVLKALGEKWDD